MRNLLLAITLSTMLVLPAVAQDQGGQGEERRARQARGGGRGQDFGGPRFPQMAERVANELQLDETQKPQYQALVEKYAQLMEEERQRAGNMEEMIQQMRDAREAGDDAKVQEIRQQMQESRRGGQELTVKFLDEVEPMLRPEQVEKLSGVRERMSNPRQFRGGPMGNLDQLKEDLKLDPQQTAQFDEMAAHLREQMAAGRGNPQMRELGRQMREAREAGDDAKVEELRQQMAELGGDPRARFEEFYTNLEAILRDDQKKTLAEYRERAQNFGGRGGEGRRAEADGVNLRSLFRAARRSDLTEEQTDAVRDLESEAREAERDAGGGRETTARLVEEYKAKVLAMLTPEQATKFEANLKETEARGDRERRRPNP